MKSVEDIQTRGLSPDWNLVPYFLHIPQALRIKQN